MKKFNLVIFLFLSQSVYAAYPVNDAVLIGVTQQQTTTLTSAINAVNASIVEMNVELSQLLYQVGTSVTQSGEKIVTAIGADGDATRNFLVSQQASARMYTAKITYSIPDNICSESASASVVTVKNGATTNKSNARAGGGGKIANTQINNYYNSPAVISEIDSGVSAKIHASYCDEIDFAAYGGSAACPEVSDMAGADKRIDSLLYGAGDKDKSPDLTFNQSQLDAAYIYIQNSGKRSISPALMKGEADTVAGAQYIGLMTQYEALISAAMDPMEQVLANSMPNDDATNALKQSLASPSAKYYWDNFGSESAKKLGKISIRELEQFEVGRRYANAYYSLDLQSMSTDNLLREQIRVSSQTNWILLDLKNQIEKNNVLTGLSVASQARLEYTPILNLQHNKVTKGMGAK